MKSYTDLKQSENLSNILPLTSADMHYERAYFEGKQSDWFIALGRPIKSDDIIPCWSLAALLNVLPKIYYPVKDHPTYLILGEPKDKWCALYWDITGMQHGEQTLADSPVDACYEMILKLYELNLL